MRQLNLQSDPDWSYFYQDDDNPFALQSINDITRLANQVFPDITSKKLYIVNVAKLGCPVSFPNKDILFLTTEEPGLHNQLIYQLGHELCHVYINSPIYTKDYESMFWFEEMLCEVASHLLLKTYFKAWQTSSETFKQDYAHHYLEYTDSIEIEPFNEKELFHPRSPILGKLLKNPVDRPKNAYIAQKLLPIFEDNPNLFKEVPNLASTYGILDFRAFLVTWQKTISDPENAKSLERIIAIFQE